MHKKTIKHFSILMAVCSLSWGFPTQCLATEQTPVNLTPKETQDLITLFKACDQAEQACSKANSDKAAVITQQQALLEETTKENADLSAKAESNVKLYLGLAIGILGTGLAAHFATH